MAQALKDADSFASIIDRYEDKLFRYILRILSVSTEDAQDILQEVFIKVYENLNDYDSTYKFSSWIYRITYNHSISYYRKRKNHLQTLSLEDSEEIVRKLKSQLDINKETDDQLQKELIQKILKGLDKKYRDPLILHYLEDKSYEEISNILKKPSGTVGTLINRAKKKFKEEYKTLTATS